MRRIVVGVDGSPGARAALEWACREAKVHDASLTAVLAWSFLGQPTERFSPFFGQEDARAALRTWVDDAAPAVEVDCQVVLDLPAAALLDAAADADLLVVGSRGLGGFKELLLGSVSSVVAERSVAPVAVVRVAREPEGRVVVGVDGSANSIRSLRWAADEARARGVSLELVHAWTGMVSPIVGLPLVVPLDDLEKAAQHELARTAEAVDLTGLDVVRHVVEGTPAGVLVDRSRSAGLIVVGSRGRGGLTAVLLGSTSRHLLHHAAAPVVVVR